MNFTSTIKQKRILSLIMLVAMIFSLCACSEQTDEPEETTPVKTAKFSIGVIQSDNTKENESSYRGFIKAFTDKGYAQNDYYSVSFTDCDDSKTKCKEAANKYVEAEVDLIFAIGEKAAVAAKKATSTIPVIFCSVYDPIESKLVKSCEKPNANITGVSDFTPVDEQFAFIRKVLPDAKRVSSLHFSSDANSILITTLAKDSAKDYDFKYSSYSALDSDKLTSVLKDALKKADALYICEDELTVENAEAIIKEANKAKVPIFAASDVFMSFGTFATCVPDYEDLGYNAGELALICLKELHSISNISVEYPVKCIGYISTSVAEKLEIEVPEDKNIVFVP